jgi:hypothetical protein
MDPEIQHLVNALCDQRNQALNALAQTSAANAVQAERIAELEAQLAAAAPAQPKD